MNQQLNNIFLVSSEFLCIHSCVITVYLCIHYITVNKPYYYYYYYYYYILVNSPPNQKYEHEHEQDYLRPPYEKGLQFGVKKCSTMLIGKNVENVLNSDLYVDKWEVEHRDNFVTGDTDLVETYAGQVKMGKIVEQKCLGFILSSTRDNMANIQMLKKNSIRTIRKIFTKLDGLKLKNYYFEVGMIFMNVMLRSSILYASETYYNLKETELRQIERIEEGYMRQLLQTARGCPIS